MPEYDVDHTDDNDSDVSARSLDSDFGVSIMRTPRVKKALTSANEKLYRSSRAKNPVTRYAYNEYMAHHYAFTMKVMTEQEPKIPSLRRRLDGGGVELPRTAQSRREPRKNRIVQIRGKLRKGRTTQSHEESRTTGQNPKKA